MRTALIFTFSSLLSFGFSQSAKKQNESLKADVLSEIASYDSCLSIYLNDFKKLDQVRTNYRLYTKQSFLNQQKTQKELVQNLSKFMDFCEGFNIDYTRFVSYENVRKAESFDYNIDIEQEIKLLSEIHSFKNVKDTLFLNGLKVKVQNERLSRQLQLYKSAFTANTASLSHQKQAISDLNNQTLALDSMRLVYFNSVVSLTNSYKQLTQYINAETTFASQFREFNAMQLPHITEFDSDARRSLEVEKREELKVPEIPALFPGGKEAMNEFIQSTIRIPEIINEYGISEKCYVQCVVKSTGEITDVIVMRGIVDCPDCSKEAARIVKQMPNWIPGKTNGTVVDSKTVIPILFKTK